MIVLFVVLTACTSAPAPSPTPTPTPTPTPSPGGGGAVVRSDSIITGEIRAIRQQTTGYPWEVDVLVQSSVSVDSLPNPTMDKVGQVITAKTDEDVSSLKAGQMITTRVKYVGDLPQPGISLYIYTIEVTPSPDEVSLGLEFTLSVGQNAAVKGENLTIKFIEVTSDSRCPRNVTCIWAGEVSCLIEVTKGTLDSYRLVLTQPGLTDQTASQDFDGYEIAFRVEPYPVAGKQIAQDEYRVVMTVTKSIQLPNVEINPAPVNETIPFRKVGKHKVAALRFLGNLNSKLAARKAKELETWLNENKYSKKAGYVFAQYNPPYIPGIFRRNEALTDV